MKPWHEKPRTRWKPHDWLYAAAAELIAAGATNLDEPMTPSRAAKVVMDFADENCGTRRPSDDVDLGEEVQLVRSCDHEGSLVEVPELGEVRCEKCGHMAPTAEKHLR